MEADKVKEVIGDIKTEDVNAVFAAKDTALEEVKTVISNVKAVNPSAEIYVVNAYSPLMSAKYESVSEVINILNEQIAAISEAEGVSVIDVSKNSDKITPISGMTSEEIAESLTETFESTKKMINEAIGSEKVAAPVVDIAYGDLNADGKVTPVDLVAMVRGNINPDSLKESYSEEQYARMEKAANVDRDSSAFGLSDIMMLKKYLIEDITEEQFGSVMIR